MSDSPLAKKLLIKPGNTFTLLDEPEGFRELLDGLPDDVILEDESSEGEADVGLLFCADREAFEMGLPEITRSLKQGAVLWVAYPKQTGRIETDLNRDILRDLAEEYGMKAVSLVAIDATWSAMRLKS